MPPSGYLTTSGIENALVHLAYRYPTICQLIVLPEQSHEGRTSRAVRIGKPSTAEKRGALFVGGLHAREIVNPDLLIYFVFRLCRAYAEETDLVIGATTFDNWIVDLVVENLDLFVFPLVNPDGRTFVQTPGGDAWWRKNRNPNPGKPCRGVDLNRNFDFLWSSGIGTSTNSCSQTYRGAAPFSEPETRQHSPSAGYLSKYWLHAGHSLVLRVDSASMGG